MSRGSFLQFGSPHSLESQAQYVAAERSEVWVNVGYRLSVFGFLACDKPRIEGNFGFKDQWMAFEWIRDNIEAFGGMIGGCSTWVQPLILLFHPLTRQEIRKIFKLQGYRQVCLILLCQTYGILLNIVWIF